MSIQMGTLKYSYKYTIYIKSERKDYVKIRFKEL